MFWSDFKRYICENLLKVTLHVKLVTFTLLHYNMAQFNTASSLAINCTLVQKKKNPKKPPSTSVRCCVEVEKFHTVYKNASNPTQMKKTNKKKKHLLGVLL